MNMYFWGNHFCCKQNSINQGIDQKRMAIYRISIKMIFDLPAFTGSREEKDDAGWACQHVSAR